MRKLPVLVQAARQLCNRIRDIHQQPGYMTIWIVASQTLGPYRGLNYADEIAKLETEIKLYEDAINDKNNDE